MMAHSTDIVGYTYNADFICPECATNVATDEIERLSPGASLRGDCDGFPDQLIGRWARLAGIDVNDERSFDSGDFPKVVFRDMLDGDERCGTCGERLED